MPTYEEITEKAETFAKAELVRNHEREYRRLVEKHKSHLLKEQ